MLDVLQYSQKLRQADDANVDAMSIEQSGHGKLALTVLQIIQSLATQMLDYFL